MPSLFSGEKGLGPFLDDLIVVLASRYGAPIDVTLPLAPEQREAWERVAVAVQHNLQNHLLTKDEQKEALLIEPQRFNYSVCFSRASYVLWRARRNRQATSSGFDITKHSIRKEIEEIYDSARLHLPSIADKDEDSDDDTNETHVAITAHTKTEEELERDRQLAEIEDDFLRRVQELQVQYFERHRKWFEVDPTVFEAPKIHRNAATLRTDNFCIENINRKSLEDVQPEELAVVLDALDISEHKKSFRRTTGSVLKQLKRDELRDRFGGDLEAADLLWAWVKERRDEEAPSASNSKSSTPVKSRTPDNAVRQQVDAMFQMFRQMNAPANNNNYSASSGRTSYTSAKPTPDPLASLRAAINPNRPPRPSAIGYDDDEAYEAAAGNSIPKSVDGEDAVYLAKVEAAVKLDPRRGQNPAPAPAASAPAPSGSAAAPPSRPNRWQVVEYDDDDDDDEGDD